MLACAADDGCRVILYCPELDEICFVLGLHYQGSAYGETGDMVNGLSGSRAGAKNVTLTDYNLTWIFVGML